MDVERIGRDILLPFFNHFSVSPPQLITDKDQQKTIGDLLCHFPKLGETSVELKIEQRFTGNLFIETWSNREFGSPGWLYTCNADILAYYFLDCDRLIICNVRALRHWCVGKESPNIDHYRERQVRKAQRIDTVGCAVPIAHLREAKLKHWFEFSPLAFLNRMQNCDTNPV